MDGSYNPDNGDFPLIKGDQSIWWVFNDNSGIHGLTHAAAIQIEVQAMAYAFASDSNEDLNNATFYDFNMTNKATDELRDAFVGLWVDFDLGCGDDDFLGYDEEFQMMYVYNKDDYDGDEEDGCYSTAYGNNIPILGIKKIDGNKVTSHLTINRDDSVGYTPMDPQSDAEFYNNLKGLWKDGTPITYGGSGFHPMSTDSTKFLFSGDPSNENEWSMCTSDLPFDDRRSLMSSAMPDLQPGQSTTASYAVIYVNDIEYPCPSLDRLKDAADAVCEAVLSSSEELVSKVNFTVSPNPATDMITITSKNSIQTINLINVNGQNLLTDNSGLSKVKILDVSSLPASIYFISIKDDQGNVAIEKLVKN